MMRWDIINFFINKRERPQWTSYLELGYYKGWSFDQVIGIDTNNKIAIDPNPCKYPYQEEWQSGKLYNEKEGWIAKTTSDQFFKGYVGPKYDIIFIDGLHNRFQVLKDLKNAFAWLNEDGVIIMHDCNPPEYLHTKDGIDGNWTGDVYKAFLELRQSREAECYVVDTDWGVGIVRPDRSATSKKGITDTEYINALGSWKYFDENRKNLLGLVDISTFLMKERERNEASIFNIR